MSRAFLFGLSRGAFVTIAIRTRYARHQILIHRAGRFLSSVASTHIGTKLGDPVARATLEPTRRVLDTVSLEKQKSWSCTHRRDRAAWAERATRFEQVGEDLVPTPATFGRT
jgi:hypothetical protein